MKRFVATLAVAALCTGIAAAQARPAGGQPEKGSIPAMISEAIANYTQIKTIILASAEKMPAENYSFKPTPEIRSYGELFTHVAQTQMALCGANGMQTNPPGQPRLTPANATAKDDVIAFLKKSFEACDATYATVTADNATEISGSGFMRGSKLGMIGKNVAHDNEMYGQMVVYMRMKGIVPPSTAMRGRM
ncbi:hypothetical protein Terro_0731 [Terriglobus roseus DSM 18391]|uniref:DinB-like domain-containing protein n=1 Tax=Terriglobus roseus (strain DSM 18391 / NRRL B-41598 / KBS 63) TaxID=926566 RepID=I3ZCU8_TERRK|nr:DinB family protein [Terriglobus roseus]AFL87066.1 hypothetical protein Terro_0731 [Terriglobus roseus DSM 18391]